MSRLLNRVAGTPKPPAVAGFDGIQRYWDPGNDCWMAKILPGEYYVTRAAEAVTTVLGSCISACIRDPQLGCGGMNHFMLPEEAWSMSCSSSARGASASRSSSLAVGASCRP